MTVAGLVLAAGEGRRFGGPKAIAMLDGERFVDRAVRVLAEAGCAPVVVVLGAAVVDVANATVVVNDQWREGIGSSLRAGLAAATGGDATHVAVLLADQPYVISDAVRRVVARRDEAPAVVATYGGRFGHPVLLSAEVWDAVSAQAVGDFGARPWMRAHPDDVLAVACDDLGSDVDVDTREDLVRLTEGERPA